MEQQKTTATINYTEGATFTMDGKEHKFESKSKMFQAMFDLGMTVGEIAKVTKAHYSFVYGVISSTREIEKKVGDSKSDKIRELAEAGKTPGQIAKELNSNYSFVHSVVKKYNLEKAKAAEAK